MSASCVSARRFNMLSQLPFKVVLMSFILFRIGFVFVVNTDDEVDGSSDAGVAFCRVWNYIEEEYDISQAFMSMISVSCLPS